MREVPTQVVLRDPVPWGFLLDSCWHVQTSFAMPRKGDDPRYEDSALPTTVQTQHTEARAYNMGMQMEIVRPQADDEEETEVGEDMESEGEEASDTVMVRLGDGRLLRLP